MWDIENHTPFVAQGMFMRDEQARSLWCLFIKASFNIRPGRTCLFRQAQEPIYQSPVMQGEDMIADTDLTLPKVRCDLLIDALACPDASGAPRMVWAALDGWRKDLQVVGEPSRGGQALPPTPLRYSFSYGGAGHNENPVGKGLDNTDDRPRVIAANASERHPKSGAFNAIPRDWPHRASMGGTYDEAWQKHRAPLLPADLDSGFWQSAPQDQQLPADCVVGRTLMLSGMTDTGSNMEIRIPAPEFEVFTRFRGRWVAQHPRLQTVLVSVPHEMLTMCWLAEMPIEAAQNDVFVDRSTISLRSAAGFAVRAEDAALFGPDRALEEA